jgi:hypothetical protein
MCHCYDLAVMGGSLGAPAERGPRGGTILSDAVGLPAGGDQGVHCPAQVKLLCQGAMIAPDAFYMSWACRRGLE